MSDQLQLRTRERATSNCPQTSGGADTPEAGLAAVLGELRSGPRVVYEHLNERGVPMRRLVRETQLIRPAVERHLVYLLEHELAFYRKGCGWCRK